MIEQLEQLRSRFSSSEDEIDRIIFNAQDTLRILRMLIIERQGKPLAADPDEELRRYREKWGMTNHIPGSRN